MGSDVVWATEVFDLRIEHCIHGVEANFAYRPGKRVLLQKKVYAMKMNILSA